MTGAQKLRDIEQAFVKNLNRNPIQNPARNPLGPVSIGPQGAMFNFQLGVQIPFRQMLEGRDAVTRQPQIPDEVLELMLREIEAEMKNRGLHP